MIIIKCTNCKKDKNEEDFSFKGGKRNKQCKKCRDYYNTLWKNNPNDYKEKRKQYYRETKEQHSLRNFKNAILKKYGITLDEYDNMLKAQQNRCAICEKEFELNRSKENSNKLPCVDHCHQTNKVRGLLCRMCNVCLGYIESGFVDKAKEYLRVNEI